MFLLKLDALGQIPTQGVDKKPLATPPKIKEGQTTPQQPKALSQAEIISNQINKFFYAFTQVSSPYNDSLYQLGKQAVNDATLSNKQKETLSQPFSTYAKTQGTRNYSLDEVERWLDENFEPTDIEIA